MTKSATFRTLVTATIAVSAACAGASRAKAADYDQTNLVSDIPGLAKITDPELVDPWGVSFTATSPFWVSNEVSNTTTLYKVTGSANVSKVIINSPLGYVGFPTINPELDGPTGQVANTNTSAFHVENGGNGQSAHFIFASQNGTIDAWNTGANAIIQTTTSGAEYTGLAINQAHTQLYAANDAGTTGSIDVFNSSFVQVSLGGGAFATPTAISALGLVPFNVQDINGRVYVTYALAGDKPQTVATAGQGAIAVFSETGTFQNMLVGGPLASPWGVALAPGDFGQFSHDLLVGNFSYVDSEINAFNPVTWAYEGTININPGAGESAGGLWALNFGIGGSNGSPNTLYFADGINGENDGLFGAISTPEPSTWAMMLAGFGGLALAAERRRRSVLPTG